MIRRRFILSSLIAVALASSALADPPVFFSEGGAAIRGYDPVAYFTEGRPVRGAAEYSVVWKGAEWRFVSAANRASFEADPNRFAPQYGGYCSYAVSRGATAPTDPEAWRVEGGKLYLNYSKQVQTIWLQDVAGNIEKADANWPAVLSK